MVVCTDRWRGPGVCNQTELGWSPRSTAYHSTTWELWLYVSEFPSDKIVVIIHTSWGSDDDYCNTDTGVPCFMEVHVSPRPFYKRPTLGPIFASHKRSKEDFDFYEKR